MRFTFGLVSVGLSLCLLAGCGSKSGNPYGGKPPKKVQQASLKPGEESTLFPAKVGNQWTYAAETQSATGSGRGEITMRVSKVNPGPDGVTLTLDTLDAEGKITQVQTWLINGKGIYQTGSGDLGKTMTAYVPIEPVVTFPVKPGVTTFSWSGTGLTAVGRPGKENVKSRVLSAQEIDTDQGTISAFPVETIGEFEVSDNKGKKVKGLVSTTTYWAPNVGIARFQQQIRVGNEVAVQTLRLKASVLK